MIEALAPDASQEPFAHRVHQWRLYRKWLDRRGLVMRQQHKTEEKAFVDSSAAPSL